MISQRNPCPGPYTVRCAALMKLFSYECIAIQYGFTILLHFWTMWMKESKKEGDGENVFSILYKIMFDTNFTNEIYEYVEDMLDSYE